MLTSRYPADVRHSNGAGDLIRIAWGAVTEHGVDELITLSHEPDWLQLDETGPSRMVTRIRWWATGEHTHAQAAIFAATLAEAVRLCAALEAAPPETVGAVLVRFGLALPERPVPSGVPTG
jgi:hypothetical protein